MASTVAMNVRMVGNAVSCRGHVRSPSPAKASLGAGTRAGLIPMRRVGFASALAAT
jgi:hypothetical protein